MAHNLSYWFVCECCNLIHHATLIKQMSRWDIIHVRCRWYRGEGGVWKAIKVAFRWRHSALWRVALRWGCQGEKGHKSLLNWHCHLSLDKENPTTLMKNVRNRYITNSRNIAYVFRIACLVDFCGSCFWKAISEFTMPALNPWYFKFSHSCTAYKLEKEKKSRHISLVKISDSHKPTEWI